MAKEKEAKPEGAPEAGADPKKKAAGGSNKIMLIIILAVVVIVNGAIAFVLIQMTKPKEETPAVAAESKKSVSDSANTEQGGASVEAMESPAMSEPPLDAIVNIAGTDGVRFLKISVVFGYDVGKYKDFGAVLTLAQPKLKDMLIESLSAMTLPEIQEPGARDKIRAKLKRDINKMIPEKKGQVLGQISEVYINEFIIQ
jgi:flagellar basal body-associated protein FliL